MSALWMNAGKDATVGTATIAATTDLFTIAAHGLVDGDTVTVDTLTGGAVGVLVADAVYFVRDATTNTFGVSLTPAGPLVVFSVDGGANVYRYAPQYKANALRRIMSLLVARTGTTHRFGARSGVRPHGGVDGHVTLVGSTWTVQDLAGVVYPGLTSLSGPYLVEHAAESGALDPADGTNDRIDAVDLQVQDDDEDAAGFRRTRIVYVAGTPAASPAEPALTANSVRLATFLVSAGGAPAPTVTVVAPFTVATGGVIPVRDTTEYPGAGGRYAGLPLWDIAAEALVVNRDGLADFRPIASVKTPDVVVFASSGSFLKADYPHAHRARVRCQGAGGAGGGAPATAAGQASVGSGGQGGAYAESWLELDSLSSSVAVTVGAGGTGVSGATGNAGGTSSFGALVSAAGGAGGAAAVAGTSNTGLSGATSIQSMTGQIRVDGGGGGAGIKFPPTNAVSGMGGSSHMGTGARALFSSGAAGSAGGQYGGGGSGAVNGESQAARAGGDGGAGVVLVELY